MTRKLLRTLAVQDQNLATQAETIAILKKLLAVAEESARLHKREVELADAAANTHLNMLALVLEWLDGGDYTEPGPIRQSLRNYLAVRQRRLKQQEG